MDIPGMEGEPLIATLSSTLQTTIKAFYFPVPSHLMEAAWVDIKHTSPR